LQLHNSQALAAPAGGLDRLETFSFATSSLLLLLLLLSPTTRTTTNLSTNNTMSLLSVMEEKKGADRDQEAAAAISLELEAAQKYYGMADSIWDCRQVEFQEFQRALEYAQQALNRAQVAANDAFEERHTALTFLQKVKARLGLVEFETLQNNLCLLDITGND
jgi:hypothetical protein